MPDLQAAEDLVKSARREGEIPPESCRRNPSERHRRMARSCPRILIYPKPFSDPGRRCRCSPGKRQGAEVEAASRLQLAPFEASRCLRQGGEGIQTLGLSSQVPDVFVPAI